MKTKLVREIEKTIRALEEFAIEWEKHFPEKEGKSSRTRARAARRRFAQILEMPSQGVAAREMTHTKYGIGDCRVGKRPECSEQAVNKW
jgi:hypothetical protein